MNATRLMALLLLVASLAAGAGEPPADGKTLHDRHCLRCHDTSVYTRDDRQIDTPSQLRVQVARCAAGPAEVDWNEEQVRAVSRYLGEHFYGF